MPKVLNLDALTKEQRFVVLGGVKHLIREMSVEDFIEITRESDRIEKEGVSLEGQIDAMIAVIMRRVPTIDDRTLRSLSLTNLRVLADFVSGQMPEGASEEAEGEGSGE